MHILFITTYFEPDSGAAAVRLSRLARGLIAQGHQITVLTTMPHYPVGKISDGYRGRFAIKENRDGMTVIRTWLWATTSPKISRKLISQISFMVTAMLRGLFFKRPDVIFIEGQPIFTNFAGVFISFIKRRPYLLNISDLWPQHLLSVGALTEKSRIYKMALWLVKRTYAWASAIVALSPAWAHTIRSLVSHPQKVSVIFNGVDLERFHPTIDPTPFLTQHQLPTDKHLITFIGTFATQYDFDTLFAVAGHFLMRHDVAFVFIGGGSQGEKVNTAHLPNLYKVAWVGHEDIPRAWATSTITIWAMRPAPLYEGTIPAKWFEATASGVPIVAAQTGIVAALIHEHGLGIVTPVGDVDGMIGGIARLLDDEALRDDCSQKARAYAEAHFSPTRVIGAYEALLKAIMR
ncbi:MAG: glycosyltransferase family 4 protein [Phototrophicales bacterium]|nr:glycosyltransferase family 4 protein [Phototrophicales bacterium]